MPRQRLILPEQTHRPDDLPIVAIDLRVALFRIMYWLDKQEAFSFSDEDAFLLCKFCWVLMLNEPLSWMRYKPSGGLQIIVLDDCVDHNKKYWRYKYYSEYKANRNYDRTNCYNMVLQAAYEYLASSNGIIPIVKAEGFEADDWAGALYRIAQAEKKPRELFLLTSDSDWGQLVNNQLKIRFANALPYKPRLRFELEIREYYKRKHNYVLGTPRDIVKHKVQFGDDSDNIAIGSPEGIIDLVSPLVKPDSAYLEHLYKYGSCNQQSAHVQTAKANILSRELKLPRF